MKHSITNIIFIQLIRGVQSVEQHQDQVDDFTLNCG